MKVAAIVLACVVGMAWGQFQNQFQGHSLNNNIGGSFGGNQFQQRSLTNNIGGSFGGNQFQGRSLTNNIGGSFGGGAGGGFRAQGGGVGGGNFGAQGGRGGGGNFGAQGGGGGGGNFGAQGGAGFGAQGGGNLGAQAGGAGGAVNACPIGTTRGRVVNPTQSTCGEWSANCFGQGLNKAECLGAAGAAGGIVAVDPFLTKCQARAASMFNSLLRIDPDGTTMIVNRFGLPIADVEVVETAFNAAQVANQMLEQEFMMLEFERCSQCIFPIPGAFNTSPQQVGR